MTRPISAMIDLETLGTGPDAVILQIGLVLFDSRPDGLIFRENALSIYVNPASQRQRSITKGTFKWWLELSDDGQERMAKGLENAIPLKDALHILDSSLTGGSTRSAIMKGYPDPNWGGRNDGWFNIREVWANGTTFDLTNLQTAYASEGRTAPWEHDGGFRKTRCQRSLLASIPGEDTGSIWDRAASRAPQDLVAHDAVDDCAYQCLVVQEAKRVLGFPSAEA